MNFTYTLASQRDALLTAGTSMVIRVAFARGGGVSLGADAGEILAATPWQSPHRPDAKACKNFVENFIESLNSMSTKAGWVKSHGILAVLRFDATCTGGAARRCSCCGNLGDGIVAPL